MASGKNEKRGRTTKATATKKLGLTRGSVRDLSPADSRARLVKGGTQPQNDPPTPKPTPKPTPTPRTPK